MTEALRPRGRALPGLGRPDRVPLDLPTAEVGPVVRAIGARATADVRRPYHLGVLLGVSACAYSISLAGVTWLQASSEAAASAVRGPAVAAVQEMAAENDRLEQALAAVRERLGSTGAGYEAAVTALGDHETRLDALAIAVADVEAQSLKLPTRISVPTRSRASLPSAPRAAAVTKPRAVATTGASGG